MPTTLTISSGSGSERVISFPSHQRRERTRTSSGESTSSGVRSFASSESWGEIEPDGIEPEDSASRSRRSHRYTSAPPPPPAPAPYHRSSHRELDCEEPHRHSRTRHREREPRSHPSSRPRRHDSHRVPSDESASSTLASQDDYPYGRHGVPPAQRGYPPPGYRGAQPPPPPPPAPGHPGYPPGMMPPQPGFPDPFGQQQALVHMSHHQDPFAFAAAAAAAASANPFGAPGGQVNPFSPIGSSGASSYFGPDSQAPSVPPQAPMPGYIHPPNMPGPGPQFSSDAMSLYGQPGYGNFGLPGYPPMPMWPPYTPPQHHAVPVPAPAPAPVPAPTPAQNEEVEKLKALLAKQEKEAEAKKNEELEALKALLAKQEKDAENKKNEELEALKQLIQKHEEARIAREKEMIAKAEAEAAAKAAEKAKQEEEAKRKEEIAAVAKKAKEEAEKKAEEAAKKAKEEAEAAAKAAKEEADKKIKEAEDAKAEADKKAKEAEAEAAKLKPPDEHSLAPIKFKDAVGRSFVFPFHLCKTWKLMEALIKQAFQHVAVVGEHVQAGHYDLTGPDGEIILPQVWETMIKPNWEVSMHMWPIPEPPKEEPVVVPEILTEPFSNLGLGGLGDMDLAMLGEVGRKKAAKKVDGKKKKASPQPQIVAPSGASPPLPPPPPPIPLPPGLMPDPMGDIYDVGDIQIIEEPSAKAKPSSSKTTKKTGGRAQVSGFAGWLTGSQPSRSKKGDEKLGHAAVVAARHGHAVVASGQQACALM